MSKDVPEDEIQEVAPEIGVPILDRLTYVNDEVLAEMFVSLLAKASTTKNADEAHPAFISIIDNLCPDEALLIKGLGFGNEIYGNFAFSPPNNSNEPLSKRLYFNEVPFLLDPSTINRVNLQYPEYGAAYIHNLKRLGLIETFLLNPEKEINKGYAEYYERIKEYYNEFLKKHPLFYDHAEVTWYFGKINFTPFGNFFKHTCNLGT